jgi:hypothetical protein
MPRAIDEAYLGHVNLGVADLRITAQFIQKSIVVHPLFKHILRHQLLSLLLLRYQIWKQKALEWMAHRHLRDP